MGKEGRGMWKEKWKQALLPSAEGGEKAQKRKIENLVVLIIIVIICILVINSIWKPSKTEQNSELTETAGRKLAQSQTQEENTVQDTTASNLEDILSKIQGVGKVKVLLTYSQTSVTLPMYNENSKQTTTEEVDTEGGERKITEEDTQKDVIFQESNGTKMPVTQSIVQPKMEGAIITATGASNIEIKTNIIQAVEAVTGLATHKIQVFEMRGE